MRGGLGRPLAAGRLCRTTILLLVLATAMMSCGSDDGSKAQSCTEMPPSSTFDACISAQTESDCLAACGSWHPSGLFPEPICNCQTGEAGQACNRQSDCLGACIAPFTSFLDCSDLREGTCTGGAPVFGCWCWFFDTDPAPLCAD